MSNINKKLRIMLVLNIFSIILAITAFLGHSYSARGKNIVLQETVLLNPRYISLVDSINISIEKPTEVLEISRHEYGYIGQSFGLTFPVNMHKVNELITNASTPVLAQVVSNSLHNHSDYEVQENSTRKREVLFSSNNNIHREDYSRLFFGRTDFTGTKRFVRSSQNSTVYAVNDDYYSFLNTAPSSWIDPFLIANLLKEGRLDEQIAEIKYTTNNSEVSLVRGDVVFEDAVGTAISLQSSVVVDVQDIHKNNYIASIIIKYEDSHSIELQIYQTDETYIVSPKTQQLSYGLEISSWTYERLIKAFTG